MLKLLICILGIFGISLELLHLRQERLAMRHEINRLHDGMEASQGKLWNQQLEIARQTTPQSLREHSKDLGLDTGGPDAPAPWTQRRIFQDKTSP